MSIAFANRPDAKRERIERVRALIARGAIKPLPKLVWVADQETGSLSGALAEDKETAHFIARTGFPLALSQWAETLAGAAARIAAAPGGAAPESFYLRWLDAIQPGADLDGVMPEVVRGVLEEFALAQSGIAQRMDPEQRALCEGLAALWRAALAGEPTEGPAWRSIRNALVALSDELSDPWCAALAEFGASMAWPPASLADECLSALQRLLPTQILHANLPGMSAAQRARAEHAVDEPRRFREAAEAPGFDMMAWYAKQAEAATAAAAGAAAEEPGPAAQAEAQAAAAALVDRHGERLLAATAAR
jgi:hypothetical protein